MKKLMTFVMLAAVVCLVVSPASADIVNTTFTGWSAWGGNNDPASGATWTASGGTSPVVSTGGQDNGAYGKLQGPSDGGGELLLDFANRGNTGSYTMTWYMRYESGTHGSKAATTTIMDDTGREAVRLQMETDYDQTDTGSNIKLTDAWGTHEIVDLKVDEWYKFELILNYVPDGDSYRRFDLAVWDKDGTSKYDGDNRKYLNNSSDSLDRIQCKFWKDDGAGNWDDIKVVPEPATMALLLIGLPFALRRRR